MFGSEILDVAIGLALVFMLASFLASALREAIESVMKSRAVYLENGVRELLGDRDGQLVQDFYEHPLIASLYRGTYETPKARRLLGISLPARRFFGGSLPTYIPARNFANAIIDLTVRGRSAAEYAAMQSAPDLRADALRRGAERLDNPHLARAVLTAIDHAGGDLAKTRENLQSWFDSAMDRVSGDYKRVTQYWLFVVGLAVAAVLNVNAIVIADHLARSTALRESIVRRAEAIAQNPEYQRMVAQDSALRRADVERTSRALADLELPIGYDHFPTLPLEDSGAGHIMAFWLRVIGGIVVTALATTLGAPFWFDLLNKIMVIRSTVKPHEKSPEESSEDRQKPEAGKSKAEGSSVTVNVQPTGAAARGGTIVPPVMAAGVAVATRAAEDPPDDYAPQEWAVGEPEEGVL